MTKLFKLSLSMFKNLILSKKNILGIAASFLYSLLWIILIHPEKFAIVNYTTEYFRLFYILILYQSFQLLDVDVKNNIHINLFTGVFTRIQIIISKFISLLFMGIYFAFIGEINNLIVCLLAKNGFGISEFFKLNHVNFVLSIIMITFTMGSLCLLILVCKLKSKTIGVICTLLLSVLNFGTTLIVTRIEYLNYPATTAINIFMKTPIYITTKLIMQVNISNCVLYLGWGVLFFCLFMVIMNKKEIA